MEERLLMDDSEKFLFVKPLAISDSSTWAIASSVTPRTTPQSLTHSPRTGWCYSQLQAGAIPSYVFHNSPIVNRLMLFPVTGWCYSQLRIPQFTDSEQADAIPSYRLMLFPVTGWCYFPVTGWCYSQLRIPQFTDSEQADAVPSYVFHNSPIVTTFRKRQLHFLVIHKFQGVTFDIIILL